MILVFIYFILFTVFAWRQWQYALYGLILIMPAYLIRFDFWGLPSTLLEITFLALFLVWVVKYARADLQNLKKFWQENKLAALAMDIFFIASVLGVLISVHWLKALGEWRAYFLEPLLLAIMIIGRGKNLSARRLLLALALSTLPISALAVAQNLGAPASPSLWNDNFGNRVTSFFTSPNAVGLYLAPLFFIILALKKYAIEYYQQLVGVSLAGLAVIAIYFSWSQGAWVGLGAGLVVFAYLVGQKKVALAAMVFGIVAVAVISPLRNAVTFADAAGQSRLNLWTHTWEYLIASPSNFIFGAGIRQFFEQVERPLFVPGASERLIYPHNLFLNFWSEIGMIGLLAFLGILWFWLYWAVKIYKNDKWLGACFVSALVAFVIHGLVDVPYFKNDLAFVFWAMWGVMCVISKSKFPMSNLNPKSKYQISKFDL